ncbi:PF20097 family protein [candidate division KSB1 bacterium]
MNCPKCNNEMLSGAAAIFMPTQPFACWLARLDWLPEDPGSFRFSKFAGAVTVIPSRFRHGKTSKGFICRECRISVIEYGN